MGTPNPVVPARIEVRGWLVRRVLAAALLVAPLLLSAAGLSAASQPPRPGSFVPVAPTRLLDTRVGSGAPAAPVPAHGTVHLQVQGRGGVPGTGVGAVVLNVTVTAPTRAGYLTAYADGTSRPTASNLNFVGGQTVPNLVIARIGADGKVALTNTSAGTTALIADIYGYYLAGTPTAQGSFAPVAPTRLLDTRVGSGAPAAPVPAHGTVHLQVQGRGGVPGTGVGAVVLNVTVTAPTRAGYLTAYADGTSRPTASNLNFVGGQTVPNLVIARIGADGKVALTNTSAGTTALIADIYGYYLAGTPTAQGFFAPVAPARLLDTRVGSGAPAAPVPAHGTVHLQVQGRGGVPGTGVGAVVLNVTVTAPTRAGYLTAYADGTSRPTASNLNFVGGQTVPNLVIARVGADGKVALTNTSAGTTALIADIYGYYLADTTPPGPVTALAVTSTSSSSIALTWSNPEDADLTGVMIRRVLGSSPPTSPTDGVLVADRPPSAPSFVDGGLMGATQYAYGLFAHDATSNFGPGVTTRATTQMALTSRVLTADGSDTAATRLVDGIVTMTAPATNNPLSNLRTVFWPTGQTPAADQEVCATWLDQSDGFVQEGVALRIDDAGDRVRALTVTKNVIYGVQWAFNVHTWDSRLGQPFTAIGQYDMSQVVTANDQYLPFPWRICARTDAAVLSFKVWLPQSETEPGWGDPVHARQTTVPGDYLAAGTAGWYIGHIPAGGSARYGGLEVSAVARPAP